MMQKFDVLVTGSAGHLGHALMLYLPTLGYKPLGIDILPSITTTFVGSFADRSFVSHILSTNPGLKFVIHAGGLHKPHVISHTSEQFLQTNVTGTLILVDEVSKCKQQISFVFVSTTSAFGSSLIPKDSKTAVWVDEDLTPAPKNIYGVSKIAAEDVCRLFHVQTGLPVIVLRVSRFFPQPDDDEIRRNAMSNDNLKLLELAYRRVDIQDVADGCVAAMKKAPEIGWARFVLSAPSPFPRDEATLERLKTNAADVFQELLPGTGQVLKSKGWDFLNCVDRVYDSARAQKELDWQPQFTIQKSLERLARGEEWRSELTLQVGRRGYHAVSTAFYTAR